MKNIIMLIKTKGEEEFELKFETSKETKETEKKLKEIIKAFEITEDSRYEKLQERMMDDILQTFFCLKEEGEKLTNRDVAYLIEKLFDREYNPPKTAIAYWLDVSEREKNKLLDKFFSFI